LKKKIITHEQHLMKVNKIDGIIKAVLVFFLFLKRRKKKGLKGSSEILKKKEKWKEGER